MSEPIKKRAGMIAQASRLSQRLHSMTVALVVALLIISFFSYIDPHGSGNAAFRWHSTLGLFLYVLAGTRLLLWWVYRPTTSLAGGSGVNATVIRASALAFYALLVALPISGWVLASEEGVPVPLFGIPALPQWLFYEATSPSAGGWHTAAMPDSRQVTALIRIHVCLAIALSAAVLLHGTLAIINARRSARRVQSA